ncbi:type II secretory pathway protein [Ahniella affigens]|uniref:Type II secretory pathway protein n=1 Tax=Ahniella affigens TaxID=2021234 RepID=A0A2P1PXK9_9GAMM|nr:type II secretion system F family protein [Ahniella affigens]AVP99570.1 type II secretory pathway protein [Ahniella affigens]
MATATAPRTTGRQTAVKAGAKQPAQPRYEQLQTFYWSAKDKRGKVMKGEMMGKNENLVKAELRKQGLTPTTVSQKKAGMFAKRGKVSAQEIAIFARQLATMMQSGVPMVQAFDIIASGQKNAAMSEMLTAVKNEIEGGSSLYEALGKFPVQFDELFRNLVRAGEQAGVLDTVLDTVATYKENIEAIKGKIKKALFYPAAVIAVALIVSAILLIFVIPQFEAVFKGFGTDLPAFTQLYVKASKFMVAYWWVVLFIGIAAAVTFLQAYKRSPAFAHFLDRMMLKLPVIGGILHSSAIARFSRTLALTFKSGVPLVEALETVGGATGSMIYNEATKRIKEDVAVGYQLNIAMRQVNLFPPMVIQMTAIGEEAGSLDTMLTKVAEFFEREVNNAVDALSSLLEPFIMVIIGTMVGSMVIAMYLPIFKMAATV